MWQVRNKPKKLVPKFAHLRLEVIHYLLNILPILFKVPTGTEILLEHNKFRQPKITV